MIKGGMCKKSTVMHADGEMPGTPTWCLLMTPSLQQQLIDAPENPLIH